SLLSKHSVRQQMEFRRRVSKRWLCSHRMEPKSFRCTLPKSFRLLISTSDKKTLTRPFGPPSPCGRGCREAAGEGLLVMTPKIWQASSPSSGSSWPVSDERVLIQRELVSISYAGCKCSRNPPHDFLLCFL